MEEFDIEREAGKSRKPTAAEVIEALRESVAADSFALSSVIVYGLSDLSEGDSRTVASVWHGLPGGYKARALRQLLETSEADFALSFNQIARLSLDDASSITRAAAVDLLWDDETPATLRLLMRRIRVDDSAQVRARAMAALGRFILLGEYGDIADAEAREARALALEIYADGEQSQVLRCHALEAIANSSEPAVEGLIRDAYAEGAHDLRRSAIVAMGRSCSPVWRDILLEELGSGDNEIVFEAAQACGQIQLEDSVEALARLCQADDREIQLMAIWALGEIGGRHALDLLSELEADEEDEAWSEALEEAIDSASFSLSLARLDLAAAG